MDFIAIDFETANAKRSSACSVGLTVVEKNRIVDTEYHLIKPAPFKFDPFNVKIHGITEADVKNAPNFYELSRLLSPRIADKTLIAHNAAFDISVIRNALDVYDAPYPSLDYLCTYRLAQTVLPDFGCYRLSYLCAHFGIKLDHHNAQSDATACAELFMKLADVSGCDTVESLVERTGIHKGEVWWDGYSPCRNPSPVTRRPNSKKLDVDEINNLDVSYLDDDFAGKYFAFTGTLLSMPRKQALELVSIAGGVAQGGITRQTNYLVVGFQDSIALKGKEMSAKQEKAINMAAGGQDIQIIREDDFLNMVDSGLWEAFHRRETEGCCL